MQRTRRVVHQSSGDNIVIHRVGDTKAGSGRNVHPVTFHQLNFFLLGVRLNNLFYTFNRLVVAALTLAHRKEVRYVVLARRVIAVKLRDELVQVAERVNVTRLQISDLKQKVTYFCKILSKRKVCY